MHRATGMGNAAYKCSIVATARRRTVDRCDPTRVHSGAPVHHAAGWQHGASMYHVTAWQHCTFSTAMQECTSPCSHLLRCANAPLHRCIGASVHRCTGAPVHRCIGASVHRCIIPPRWPSESKHLPPKNAKVWVRIAGMSTFQSRSKQQQL